MRYSPLNTCAEAPRDNSLSVDRSSRIRIAFDVSQTGNGKAGCGYLAYSLAQELVRQTELDIEFLRSFGTSWWDPDNPSLTIPGGEDRAYHAAFVDHADAIKFWAGDGTQIHAAIGSPEIVHSNNFYCPIGKRPWKLVYTLHDMTVFDFPQFTSDANRRACVAQLLRAAACADFVVANSQASLDAFQAYFKMEPQRTAVIDLGARPPLEGVPVRPASLKGVNAFFLGVGTIEPRKNYDALLMAFARIVDKVDVDLVIAGRMGWEMSHLPNLVEALGASKRIHFASYVSEAELEWLYTNTQALVYPSHAEGFGLPVLEAMSFGCPVICSNSTSLPEVAGDAALLVDPQDVADLAGKMEELSSDPGQRKRMSQASRARSKRYSWSAAALQLNDIYSRVRNLPMRFPLSAAK